MRCFGRIVVGGGTGLVLALAATLAVPALAESASRDPLPALRAANAPLVGRAGDPLPQKLSQLAMEPGVFFRGSAALFYADLAREPALKTTVRIPLQGDLHLGNLGVYRTRLGKLAFDLDDFDDACRGPYTWELARCAVSIRLTADSLGMSATLADGLVGRYLRRYLTLLAFFKDQPAAARRPLTAEQLTGPALEALDRGGAASRAAFLQRWLEAGRFKRSRKVASIPTEREADVRAAFVKYAAARPEGLAHYTVKDMAAFQAGVGSLGRFRYLVLIEGPGFGAADDRVLELKEEWPAAAGEPLDPAPARPAWRVARALAYFVPDGDGYLGHTRIGGQEYLVHEVSPEFAEVDVDRLKGPGAFASYLDTVALATARAHARSGQVVRILADAGDAAGLVERVGGFSAGYARQVQDDCLALKAMLAAPAGQRPL